MKTVKNFEIRQKQKKNVQALLGLGNYYDKLIPHFAEKTVVQSSLLCKENKKKIIWSQQI